MLVLTLIMAVPVCVPQLPASISPDQSAATRVSGQSLSPELLPILLVLLIWNNGDFLKFRVLLGPH